jgi:hypothetical protein
MVLDNEEDFGGDDFWGKGGTGNELFQEDEGS